MLQLYIMTSSFPKNVANKAGWPWTEDIIPIVYDPAVQWPKISIVTPSFNQGQYIEETIRSVLLQNYPNLEYIIIDGGSTDETVAIIKKYEHWISYWVSEADRGQSHAINKGLEKCTGDIFNWLNSDDYYYPDTFYQIATGFLNNPQATIVSGKERHLNIDGSTVIHNGTFITETILKTLEFVELAQPSSFFLADYFKKVGPLAEDLHYIMDGEFWVRYLLLCGQASFYKIDKPLVNFRIHGNSKTVQSSVNHHFLFERSSILVDLQRYVGVPAIIVDYWINEVYQTPTIYPLNREWKFNESYVSKRYAKLYFIKKYILLQFQKNNKALAYGGLKQLLKNYCFDLFTVRCIIKLLFKK